MSNDYLRQTRALGLALALTLTVMPVLSPWAASAAKSSGDQSASTKSTKQSNDKVPKIVTKKIIVTARGDSIDPESFAGKPRVYYRAGTTFARVEQLSEGTKPSGMLVVSAPDIWMIDPVENVAKHIVDNNPPSAVRMPILSRRDEAFKDLEFGREMEFFKSLDIEGKPGPKIDGKPSRVYQYAKDGNAVKMFASKQGKPLLLEIDGRKGKTSFAYSTYQEIPFTASLFQAPPGLKVVEASSRRLTSKQDEGLAEKLRELPHYKPIQEPKTAVKAIDNNQDAQVWLTYYYLFPESQLTIPAMKAMEKMGYMEDFGASFPVCAFLSKIFEANPDKVHEWVEEMHGLSPKTQETILPLVLRWADTDAARDELKKLNMPVDSKYLEFEKANLSPEKLNTFYISSPSNLDMLWGCFMATGDERYVQKIMTTLPWMRENTDHTPKFAIGAAAAYSLWMNAKQHKKVLEICKAESEKSGELQAKLKKIVQLAESDQFGAHSLRAIRTDN
ncbi:MAG: hypothetical protein J0H83_11960 [Candidatus Melainabacteria bacterium]|jgi:hypothetical protein|nr:hypothetical protein [Candidatus Melainabacteria bacterium]MBX9672158.1 hypothetical protein [Candidatus Obscuribacterales bacterium]